MIALNSNTYVFHRCLPSNIKLPLQEILAASIVFRYVKMYLLQFYPNASHFNCFSFLQSTDLQSIVALIHTSNGGGPKYMNVAADKYS